MEGYFDHVTSLSLSFQFWDFFRQTEAEASTHEHQLTGLMSLFSEAMKSTLLTCSFSAVSMFTSTVLLACSRAAEEAGEEKQTRRCFG